MELWSTIIHFSIMQISAGEERGERGEERRGHPPVMAAQSPETLPPSNLPAPHKLIWRLFTGTSPPSSLPPWYKQYLLTTLTPDDTVSFFVVLYVFTLPPIKAYKCFARTFLTFSSKYLLRLKTTLIFWVNFIKMLTYINLQIYCIEYFQCRYLSQRQ